MASRALDTDYLGVGSGAAGMAFTDSLITETDARIVMVDRRSAPGGHWNDVYPFVRLHQPSLYYGVNDGQLVVTDSSNALAELNGSVGRLSGDDVFKEAKDGAGMTDSAQTFIFLDIKDALPALSGFAQLANQTLPPELESNLRPLRSALLFGSSDSSVGSFVVYVKTS